jgi:SAM-dependent methyltransferase
MARFDAARIRGYYDRNTAAFVSFGQGGDVGAIHRAVWGPGVRERQRAFRFVEERIAAVAEQLPTPLARQHIVDLGCGVGASLCYLAERLPIRGTGITLSPAQAARARQRVREAGLEGRVSCLEGDYGDLPPVVPSADLAFAIESFVHAPDPARFFAECARLVRPGGALAICDDFRRATEARGASAAIERFCRGWHINTFLTSDELVRLAHDAGFAHVSTEPLSAYLELNRPRDRAIAAFVAPLGRLPWRWARLDPMIGGAALRTCLTKGWIGYDFVVFRRE